MVGRVAPRTTCVVISESYGSTCKIAKGHPLTVRSKHSNTAGSVGPTSHMHVRTWPDVKLRRQQSRGGAALKLAISQYERCQPQRANEHKCRFSTPRLGCAGCTRWIASLLAKIRSVLYRGSGSQLGTVGYVDRLGGHRGTTGVLLSIAKVR